MSWRWKGLGVLIALVVFAIGFFFLSRALDLPTAVFLTLASVIVFALGTLPVLIGVRQRKRDIANDQRMRRGISRETPSRLLHDTIIDWPDGQVSADRKPPAR